MLMLFFLLGGWFFMNWIVWFNFMYFGSFVVMMGFNILFLYLFSFFLFLNFIFFKSFNIGWWWFMLIFSWWWCMIRWLMVMYRDGRDFRFKLFIYFLLLFCSKYILWCFIMLFFFFFLGFFYFYNLYFLSVYI